MSADRVTPGDPGVSTWLEIDGEIARYVVRTADEAHQHCLVHMGYERLGAGISVRRVAATDDVGAIHANLARHLNEILEQGTGLRRVDWQGGLTELLRRLDRPGVDMRWFVYGSGALAAPGIDVMPGDLDVWVSDAHGAAELLADLLVEPVTERPGWVAARTGRAFHGVIIEWLGDADPALDDPAPTEHGLVAARRIETVRWRGRELPVAPLDLQLATAERRGLHERVAKIRAFQARSQTSGRGDRE
jgi:hypothetical protein